MSTPLPTSPAKPRTPASSARAKSHKLGRPFLLGAVTAILLAGLTALAIPYCQKYNCPERAQHAYESSVAQAQHCYTATVALGQQYTTVAVDWTKHSAGVVTEAAKTNWGRVAERAGQALDAAKAQYEAVVRITNGTHRSLLSHPVQPVGLSNERTGGVVLSSLNII